MIIHIHNYVGFTTEMIGTKTAPELKYNMWPSAEKNYRNLAHLEKKYYGFNPWKFCAKKNQVIIMVNQNWMFSFSHFSSQYIGIIASHCS